MCELTPDPSATTPAFTQEEQRAAIVRGDIAGVLEILDPDLETSDPFGFSTSEAYHGHQGFVGTVRDGLDAFERYGGPDLLAGLWVVVRHSLAWPRRAQGCQALVRQDSRRDPVGRGITAPRARRVWLAERTEHHPHAHTAQPPRLRSLKELGTPVGDFTRDRHSKLADHYANTASLLHWQAIDVIGEMR